MKILVLALSISLSAIAQSAKVQELTPAETAEIKALENQLTDIQAKIWVFRDQINKKYLVSPTPIANTSMYANWYSTQKPGWQNGFEYSEDYRFIVPVSSKDIAKGAYCQVPFTATSTIGSSAVIDKSSVDIEPKYCFQDAACMKAITEQYNTKTTTGKSISVENK